MKQTDAEIRRQHQINITDVRAEHVGPVYLIKVTACDQLARQEIVIEAVDLGSLKGQQLADAIRIAEERALHRVTMALAGDQEESDLPANVTHLNGHQVAELVYGDPKEWKCSKGKKLKVLTLWNNLISLGISEDELRETMEDAYHVKSRKDLEERQAEEFISWMAGAFNSIQKQQKEATQ